MLSDPLPDLQKLVIDYLSLNAPFGARCFLTAMSESERRRAGIGLNAPFGARYLLTARTGGCGGDRGRLNDLLALGAF